MAELNHARALYYVLPVDCDGYLSTLERPVFPEFRVLMHMLYTRWHACI